MRMVVAARIACAAILATVQPASAQILDMRPPRFLDQWVWGASAFGGIPRGDFAKNEDGGGGFEGMVGFQPFRRQPLLVRTHLAYLIYGNISATAHQDVCDFFGCRTESIEYTARRHAMTSLHLGPEFFATDGTFRPFAYAMGGWSWFRSSAYEPPVEPGGSSPESVKLFSSRNSSTAYGAGVRWVTTRFGREYGLEIGGRLTRNFDAVYLTDGGVQIDTLGNATVTPTQSDADVLGLHIGFWIGPFINWDERSASSRSSLRNSRRATRR